MTDLELYHHGVKGMRWGVRKDEYLTAKQIDKNAKNAGREAWRKSVSDNGGKLVGKSKLIAVYKNPIESLRGRKASREAYKNAQEKSIADDNAYNKRLKAENKASNPNRKREIAIATTAVVGTSLAAYGVYKVSTAIKNNAFKHNTERGMKAAKRLMENGQSKRALETLYDSYSHHGDSTISVIKRTISNNEVRGKVDWRNVAKTLIR